MRTTLITLESGTGFRCRSRRRRALAALAATVLTAGLAACDASGSSGTTTQSSDGVASDAGAVTAPVLDAGSEASCLDFWGDPDYQDTVSRTVLDRAATARAEGADDPMFYALTGDDVDAVFEQAQGDVDAAASELAGWFRSEPERGQEADLDAFVGAWESLAAACAPASQAALWASGQGEDGTKPGALVCADITDTPSTLNVYANANVLTSNMFDVVGLYPRTVGEDQMDLVRGTDEILAREIAAVDDDAVRSALEEIRVPFRNAIDGDRNSPGLQESMRTFGDACGAAGYDIPPMTESGQDEEGLV